LNSSAGEVARHSRISGLVGNSYQLAPDLDSIDWSLDCRAWDDSTKRAVAVHVQVDGEDVGVVPHVASVEQLIAKLPKVPGFLALEGYDGIGLPGSLLVSDLVQPVLGPLDNKQFTLCLLSGGPGVRTVSLALESDIANELIEIKVLEATTAASLRRCASDLVYDVRSECLVDSDDAELDDSLPVTQVAGPEESLQLILIPDEKNVACWLRCSGQNCETLDRPCSFPECCSLAEWNRIVQRAARLVILERFDDFYVDDASCEFDQHKLDVYLKSGSVLKCTAWSQALCWRIEVYKGTTAPWTIL